MPPRVVSSSPASPLQHRTSAQRLCISAGQSLALVAAVTFLLRLLIDMATGWATYDEAWLLQVVYRSAHGDLLYRDICYNTFPLPIYVGRAGCALFGYSVLTMKGIIAAIDVVILIATHRFLAALGRDVSPWRLALFLLLLRLPPYCHLYNDLATCLVMVSGVAYLKWRQHPSPLAALLLGLCVGLTIACKHTVGCYFLLAISFPCLLGGTIPFRRRVVHFTLVGAVAALTTLAFLLPILLAGAWHDLLLFTFTIMSQYLEIAGVNFFEGFGQLAWTIPHLPAFEAVADFASYGIFPLAVVAGALFVGRLWTTWRKGAPDTKLLLAAPVFLVLVATVYPRADVHHVGIIAPAVVCIFFLAAPAWGVFRRKASRVAVAFAGLVLALLLGNVGWRFASSNYAFATLPHLHGILLTRQENARLAAVSAALQNHPRPIFIVSAEAGALHLLSGVPSPTRYDYPIDSEFPPGAQESLFQDILAGRIPTVFVDKKFFTFRPNYLYDAVTTKCRKTGQVEAYDIYEPPLP